MVRVAIIGCGSWGISYVRVFNELPASQVVLVCDANEERLRTVRERYRLIGTTRNWQDVLTDKSVSAVVVVTPATTHFTIAQQCLLMGKHVLVEKPLTTSVEDGEALVETAEKNGQVLMVGHTFLYNAGIRKVKELMSSQDFGKIYYLHATRTNMGPIRPDVHVFWDLASHDVAIFNYLLDAHPLWVSAVGSRVLGSAWEDVGFATLNYRDGVIANVHISWVDPNKVREVAVVGSQRRIVFDDLNNLERVRVFEKGISCSALEAGSFGEFRLLVRDGDIISPRVEASEPLKNVGEHFLECIAQGKRPVSDGWNGLAVVRVMSAIDKSLAQNGVPVEVT